MKIGYKIHRQGTNISISLADLSQLSRWAQLLKQHAGDAVVETQAVGPSPRASLIRALHRVRAVRGGNIPHHEPAQLAEPTMLPAPASLGSAAAVGVWEMYSKFIAGDQSAAAWLTEAVEALCPTALIAGPGDNPEPGWQSEMVILHALHAFALIQRDPALIQKTLRCTQFHLEEIQPDHATNEPWAIHAYASHPDGAVTAETLLHAALMHHGGTLSEPARLIAHDAAAALEAYLAP
ncbi:MAG: hypothetical protein ACTHLZ_10175 [Tepidisphaeraceae bacterium]